MSDGLNDFEHLATGELLAVRQYWRTRARGTHRQDGEARMRLAALEAEIARRRAGWTGESQGPQVLGLPFPQSLAGRSF